MAVPEKTFTIQIDFAGNAQTKITCPNPKDGITTEETEAFKNGYCLARAADSDTTTIICSYYSTPTFVDEA